MKRVILGTAGHIDHGKTELIRALTGIDTDRLKEEKARGISIELGFAFLDLGEDVRLGIIDVPGHERFVRQMVAGSGGVDIAALVVALDEGVMPQTSEHLDILSLLDIPQGLVVLTKLDLVDEELAMLAEEDARDLVKGTFLEDAPMVKVSAKSGEGLEELRSVLAQLASKAKDRPVHGLLRLPVDRVFTMKGHGTVVAGTLISGSISVGDEVEILPESTRSSVRSIQSHNQQEETAGPGQRVAVNLRGLDASEVHRGAVLTHSGDYIPASMIDVRLKALPRAPFAIRNRQKVRLHHYTSEVEARLVLPDRELLEPGEEVLAQLRTAAPIVPAAGDRFVIRALSPSVTLGGGTIANPRGLKLRARSVQSFLQLDPDDEAGIVEAVIRNSGLDGCTRHDLLALTGLSAKRLDKTLDALCNARTAVKVDPTENRLVHGYFARMLEDKLLGRIKEFHQQHPLKEGIPKQELRSLAPGSDKLFRKIIQSLIDRNEVTDEDGKVRMSSHKVTLKEDEKNLKDSIMNLIAKTPNAPPTFKDMVAQTGKDSKQLRNMLELLAQGRPNSPS